MNDESLAGSGGDTRPLPLTRPLLGLPTLPRAYQVNLQVPFPFKPTLECLGSEPSHDLTAVDTHAKFYLGVR